jgi:hypothetical protein
MDFIGLKMVKPVHVGGFSAKGPLLELSVLVKLLSMLLLPLTLALSKIGTMGSGRGRAQSGKKLSCSVAVPEMSILHRECQSSKFGVVREGLNVSLSPYTYHLCGCDASSDKYGTPFYSINSLILQ